MIRFLILCTIFFLLYFGFNTINEFDSAVNISVLDYQIQTTIFTFSALFIIVQLLLMIVLKTIFSIFDLPFIISRNWYKRKLQRINERLLKIISELIMGNRQKSLELTNKILPDLDENCIEFRDLVLAESTSSFDMQIQRLRTLLGKKYIIVYMPLKGLLKSFSTMDGIQNQKNMLIRPSMKMIPISLLWLC